MPRAKPKAETFLHDGIPVSLPLEVRTELLDILDLDDQACLERGEQMIKKVEKALQFFPYYVDCFDNAPRPANFLAEIRPLLASAKTTLQLLQECSQKLKTEIAVSFGGNTPEEIKELAIKKRAFYLPLLEHEFERNLQTFIQLAAQAESKFQSQSSQRGKTKFARLEITKRMDKIFMQYNQSDQEFDSTSLEIDFIRVAYQAYNALKIVSVELPTDPRLIQILLNDLHQE